MRFHIFALLLTAGLFLTGCDDSDSSPTEPYTSGNSQEIGTWITAAGCIYSFNGKWTVRGMLDVLNKSFNNNTSQNQAISYTRKNGKINYKVLMITDYGTLLVDDFISFTILTEGRSALIDGDTAYYISSKSTWDIENLPVFLLETYRILPSIVFPELDGRLLLAGDLTILNSITKAAIMFDNKFIYSVENSGQPSRMISCYMSKENTVHALVGIYKNSAYPPAYITFTLSKNQSVYTPKPRFIDTASGIQATSLFIDSDSVYIAGDDAERKPCYWKNFNRVNLEFPASYRYGKANFIQNVNNHIVITGIVTRTYTSWIGGGETDSACYWIDGKFGIGLLDTTMFSGKQYGYKHIGGNDYQLYGYGSANYLSVNSSHVLLEKPAQYELQHVFKILESPDGEPVVLGENTNSIANGDVSGGYWGISGAFIPTTYKHYVPECGVYNSNGTMFLGMYKGIWSNGTYVGACMNTLDNFEITDMYLYN